MIERIVEIQVELSRQMADISIQLTAEGYACARPEEANWLRSRLSVLEDVSYLIAGKFEDELEEYLVSLLEERGDE